MIQKLFMCTKGVGMSLSLAHEGALQRAKLAMLCVSLSNLGMWDQQITFTELEISTMLAKMLTTKE